jgi:hypothetical protein
VKLSPGGEILSSQLHSSKQYRVFTPGGERRGEHSPLGDTFHPRVPGSSLGVKLRMALSPPFKNSPKECLECPFRQVFGQFF